MGRGTRDPLAPARAGAGAAAPALRTRAAGRPGWLEVPEAPDATDRFDLPLEAPELDNLLHVSDTQHRLAFCGGDLFIAPQSDGRHRLTLGAVSGSAVTVSSDELAAGVLGALGNREVAPQWPVRLRINPATLNGILTLGQREIELGAPQVGVLVGIVQGLAGAPRSRLRR